jgi:hypothetical protein
MKHWPCGNSCRNLAQSRYFDTMLEKNFAKKECSSVLPGKSRAQPPSVKLGVNRTVQVTGRSGLKVWQEFKRK